ncbi:MAG: citramalate synthase [Candidatus Latescibacterota bacterium]
MAATQPPPASCGSGPGAQPVPQVVEVYDSTLRDGAQAEGITYSLDDKLLIARRLDELGVHYIEGGWPNPTSRKDLAFFEEVRKLDLRGRVTAFGSTRRPGNLPQDDPTLNTLLRAETQSVALFAKSWTLHVEQVLRIGRDVNLQLIEDSVAFLVSHGREVIYDAEHFFDGYRNDPEYALSTLLAAERGGARILVLCDTNGGALTWQLADVLRAVRPRLSVPFGIHTHNDAGLAVANTLAAVELGAVQVQGTFNGYGERCGNANLCTVIPNLELKMGRRCIGGERLAGLMEFSRFLSEVANVYHDHRQPYVGESAFVHKGGVHIDAMMKSSASYEHCDPEVVGNARRYLLSDQSGSSTIVSKLERLCPGIDKRDPTVTRLLSEVKEREHEGYQYEAAEASFELMAQRVLGRFHDRFRLVNFRTINRKSGEAVEESEAIVKVEVDGQVLHTVAEGDGPVNALDRALRKALEGVYPVLRSVHLEDYKVRVLSSSDGTAAKVRVLIESSDGRDVWGTVGVSENIIEASWIALADSLHYKLMKEELAP